MKDYQITKTTVECYRLRHSSGMYWADITVDANGNTGRLQIASDYGSWQYYWGACGRTFKEFLLQVHIGYVAGRFGEDHHFDCEKTIAFNKKIVLDWRKQEGCTQDQARKMWDELSSMTDCTTSESFARSWYDQDALPEFFDEHPDIRTSISPQFQAFWENVWPAFCAQIRQELTASALSCPDQDENDVRPGE
jgi:hypothetical protein